MRGTLKFAKWEYSACLMFAALAWIPAAAQGENLQELFLPQSGHIEMKAAIGMELTNADVKTIEDVLALREKLNDGPLDEESVTSWKFLERADLEIVEPELPPPLLNLPAIQIVRRPDWRNVAIDFEGSRRSFSVDVPDQRLRSEVTAGAKSCFELEKLDGRWTYRHFNYYYVQGHPWKTFNCERLFGREAFLFRNNYSVRPVGDFELFNTKFDYKGRHELLLVDRAQDAVLIRASRWIHNDRIDSFTLHLQMKSEASPQSHQVPAVTMHFDRGRGVGLSRTWNCDIYWLEKADFDIKFPSERFVVNVPAKERYHAEGEKYYRWLKAPILDITSKTPAEVLEELNSK